VVVWGGYVYFSLIFLFSLSWSSGVSLLPTSKVVELLFPLARSGGGWPSPSLFGLWWLVICFSLLFLSFWQNCSSQDVFYGWVTDPTCRRRDDFWQVFRIFFVDFGSQIYTYMPNSDLQAPPSRIPCHLPPLPPQAPVVSIIGDRRVVPTRLGALYSLAHMRATLCFFKLCTVATGSTVSDLRLCGFGDGVCPTPIAVRCLWPPSPLPTVCFWVFLLFCVCVIILFFSDHSLLVFGSNFMKIFVG
jgi:hypothetical protein